MSERKCPFCGGELPDKIRLPIDDPIFDDVAHFIVAVAERRPVPRGTWLVLLELRRAYPRTCSRELLLEAVPANDHVHALDRDPSQVAYRINHLRRLLHGTRYDIATIRGFGYRLVMK